jgi:hypothetical protein
MKAHLLYPDHDFDQQQPLPAHEADLSQDLGLSTILAAMADDDYLLDVARQVVHASLLAPTQIRYRQRILADFLAQPGIVRGLYELAVEAIMRERRAYWGVFSQHPDSTLRRSIEVLGIFLDVLKRVRALAEASASQVRSDALTRLFAMLRSELDDDYLATVEQHLRTLTFRSGALISASLGAGNKGTDYVLHQQDRRRHGLMAKLRGDSLPSYTVTVADRDEAGMRALGELRERGINLVANALAQSCEHILSFFQMMRFELGFYVGCINLSERLAERGRRICFPDPQPTGGAAWSADGLYDAALAVRQDGPVIGNRLVADGKTLIVITGANQGGKSTFLRSLGLAQLMMQAGMFVTAEVYRAEICHGVLTHYKREEDTEMRSGKLDEELARMSQIADAIKPGDLLLSNESFAATNEREGSEIARQVIHAMVDSGVKIALVTHLYDLSHGEYIRHDQHALFLRADRREDGTRSFTISPGEPLPTSFGPDLYHQIFDKRRSTAPPQPNQRVRQRP